MDQLNLVSFIFLVVLFVLTPRGALRSARLLRQVEATGAPLPRMRMALSTMFALAVIWLLSSINAIAMGRSLFATGGAGLREIALGAGAFVLLLGAIPLARSMRTPEQDRRSLIYGMAPRNGREFALFVVIAVMAGVAEEAAYRGVAVWILAPVMGNVVPAMFLSAMAFAVAHAVQGGKNMALIFVIAAVFHALVYFTGTLVIAMVVHAAYDIVAGYLAGLRAKQILAEDGVAGGSTPA
ncbi:MAG: CPBP family intramembrane metalloprotease [Gemmatimonadetes bacterium]|nr:CPBP family intramembrane metalloprotease [Gemmatimonadota bacterium]